MKITAFLLLLMFCLLSCKKEVNEKPDISGTWVMDIQLGSGICDETLLRDEESASPRFRFNADGTLTFETDPAGADLNNKELFDNTYVLEEGTLTIKIHYYNKTDNERIDFEAKAEYAKDGKKFSGAYANKWSDGEICGNRIDIHK
jgi:hypothetical protein